MGVTHTNIYNLQANQFLAQSATPTDRENPEYQVGSYIAGTTNTLEDGDCWYDTDNNTWNIRIGATIMKIEFTSTV